MHDNKSKIPTLFYFVLKNMIQQPEKNGKNIKLIILFSYCTDAAAMFNFQSSYLTVPLSQLENPKYYNKMYISRY